MGEVHLLDYFSLGWRLDAELWSKEDGLPDGMTYPAFTHLLDSSAACLAVWDMHCSEAQQRSLTSGLGLDPDSETDLSRTRALLACWAGWHDLGKIGPYQGKVPAAYARLSSYPALSPTGLTAHGRAGHLALAAMLPAYGYDDHGDGLAAVSPARRVAQILGGHHGRNFPQPLRRHLHHPGLRADLLGAGKWDEQRTAHLELVAAALGNPQPPTVLSVQAAVLAAEAVVLSDWLVSQLDYVVGRLEPGPWDADRVVKHWEQSLADGPRLVEEAGLGLPLWTETPVS